MVESKIKMNQHNNNEFSGRLSLRSSNCSAAFQQDWRTVADPSFEHLTFGTNNNKPAQQVNNNIGDGPDATKNFAYPFVKNNPGNHKTGQMRSP